MSDQTPTLGDALRAAADYQDRPGAHAEMRALADRADELEGHLTLARNNARLALDQRNEARAQVERVRAAIDDDSWLTELSAERLRAALDGAR
jgi:hypothetical protein